MTVVIAAITEVITCYICYGLCYYEKLIKSRGIQ